MDRASNDTVTVRVPARAAYVGLLRSMIGSVGAGMRLPIDSIDDMRIAVHEAFALLAPLGTMGRPATLELESTPETLKATLRMTVDRDRDWPPSGFERTLGWKVLVGLTDEAAVGDLDGEGFVALIKRTLADG